MSEPTDARTERRPARSSEGADAERQMRTQVIS